MNGHLTVLICPKKSQILPISSCFSLSHLMQLQGQCQSSALWGARRIRRPGILRMGPEAGWQFAPFMGDMRQSYPLLPVVTFGYLLCTRLLSLTSASLFASCPPRSSFLILVKAPLLHPFTVLIFGSCPLSLHT